MPVDKNNNNAAFHLRDHGAPPAPAPAPAPRLYALQTCKSIRAILEDSSLWRGRFRRILGKLPEEAPPLTLRDLFKQEYGLHNNWQRGVPTTVVDLGCEKPRGMTLQGSRLLLAFYDKTVEERDLGVESGAVVRTFQVGNTVACLAASFDREEFAVGTFVK